MVDYKAFSRKIVGSAGLAGLAGLTKNDIIDFNTVADTENAEEASDTESDPVLRKLKKVEPDTGPNSIYGITMDEPDPLPVY